MNPYRTPATANAVLLRAVVAARARQQAPPVPDAHLLFREMGAEPDPWQRDLLVSEKPRILVNASRQSGKSTTVAVLAVHTALAQPGALILLVSPSLRQSSELFRKVGSVYRRLGRPVSADAETKLTLELSNGSRVVSLPGSESTIRGYSAVSLLICDEASRIDDAMLAAVRPMLAVSGGRLIALSTPFGMRGWWYEAWSRGEDDWQRFLVPATLCPRISQEFLDQERRALSPLAFRSEYGCEFVDTDDQLFASELVQAALADDIRPFADLPELPALSPRGDTAVLPMGNTAMCAQVHTDAVSTQVDSFGAGALWSPNDD